MKIKTKRFTFSFCAFFSDNKSIVLIPTFIFNNVKNYGAIFVITMRFLNIYSIFLVKKNKIVEKFTNKSEI